MPKNVTVSLDPALHKAFKVKSMISGISISELVNEAVCEELLEDFREMEKSKMEKILKGSVLKGENRLTP